MVNFKKNIALEQTAILEFVKINSTEISTIIERLKVEGMGGYYLNKDGISLYLNIESNIIRLSIKNKLLDFTTRFDKVEDGIYESYVKQIEMFAKQKLVKKNNKYYLL